MFLQTLSIFAKPLEISGALPLLKASPTPIFLLSEALIVTNV